MNEQIRQLRYSSAFDEYVCECGLKSCVGPLSLSHEEYDEIRRQPGCLVVRPGHWSPRYDRVVRETPRYQVIEKIAEAVETIKRVETDASTAVPHPRPEPTSVVGSAGHC